MTNPAGSLAMDIPERVLRLVENVTGIGATRMRADPDLYLNVTVDGDDAVELIERFATEFEVDMSDYLHSRYFGDEGMRDPFSVVAGWISGRRKKKFEPLTVRNLIEAAEARRWTDRSAQATSSDP